MGRGKVLSKAAFPGDDYGIDNAITIAAREILITFIYVSSFKARNSHFLYLSII